MSISDEIQRLYELQLSGALTPDEFRKAKGLLLEGKPTTDGAELIGKTAERYVDFNIKMTITGLIIAVIIFFVFLVFFLPNFIRVQQQGPFPGFFEGNGKSVDEVLHE